MNSKVLILDDDADFNSLLTDVFEQADYEVTSLLDPLQALELFSDGNFDLVVTDHKMPDMTGTEFMKRIKVISPETPIIMVSGYLENDAIRDLISDGVGGVFLKPLNIFSLLERTSELIEETRNQEASSGSNSVSESAGAFIQPSHGLEFTFRSYPCLAEKSRKFAERLYGLKDFRSTLTLTGENGMHFRAICEDIAGFYERNYEHFFYFDKDSLDQATILASLQRAVQTECERITCVILGADTLNDAQKVLLVQLAKHEGVFEATSVSIRLIFCLCGDIDTLFDEGLIDEHLYILMGTAEVPVPALRECAKDIPVLAQKLAVDSFRELGKDSVPTFDKEAKDYLQKQPWPENYTELSLTVRKAMERISGSVITLDVLTGKGPAIQLTQREIFQKEIELFGDQAIQAAWSLLDKDTSLVAELFGTDIEAIEQRLN
jgi:DNA-binding NtrC family response regulator